jgi:hypothetical protein
MQRTVPFTCHLQVLSPSKNESYHLLVFASRDSQSHAVFNEVVRNVNEKFHFDFPLSTDEPPSVLHLCLYATRPDKNQLMCQSVLAWGNMLWPGGMTALYDVKKHPQAIIEMHTPGRQSMLVTPMSPTADISAALISKVRAAYPPHDTNSYLNWVVTPMGDIPVLPFVASISSILTDAQVDNERGEEFLKHQFAIAGTNTGLSSTGWSKCTHAQKSTWVAEAMTIIPRAMIYVQDTVRVGRSDAAADQWVHLLSFPDPDLAGFDCEDSAITVLELLYLLQHLHFDNAMMREVQAFCAPYTACFVFGSLKINGKYSPHAYAALMDSDFLDGKRGAAFQPAIIFEGTARIGGSWCNDPSTTTSMQSFAVHSQLLKALGENKGYARILRSEASLSMVDENHIYGPVYAFITGDHRGQHEAVHLLVRSKSGGVGVPAHDVFSQLPSNRFLTAARYFHSNDCDFSHLCNELPRSHIPYVSKSKRAAHATQGQFHVDIHFASYMQRKNEVLAAIDSMRGEWRITPQTLEITDCLKVQQFWFEKK